jgi:acid phosphatase
MGRKLQFVVFLALLSLLAACGGSSSNSGGSNSGGNPGGNNGGGSTASIQHVVVVIFENQNYSDVVGNAAMPTFNSIAQSNSLATQFYADTHPSIGNYFMLTAGANPTGNDDAWAGTYSGDNIARQLTAAGKSWKIYAESLPSTGYVGGDQYPYIKHHNPFAYFDDVINSSTQKANIVSFSQFSSDVTNNSLPSFALVVPNNQHNGHDCPTGGSSCPLSDRLGAIDSWLNSNLSSLLQNSSFTNTSVLILTFDESATDNTHGGGRIPLVFAGGTIKTAYQSTTTYQFPSVLRFSLEKLGVSTFPNAAATAPSMNEFLK